MEEAAPQEGVGQFLFVVGGDEHHRTVPGLDQFARLVDIEFHAIEFAQQVVWKLNVGLVNFINQQHHLLVGVECPPQHALVDIVAYILDLFIAQL